MLVLYCLTAHSQAASVSPLPTPTENAQKAFVKILRSQIIDKYCLPGSTGGSDVQALCTTASTIDPDLLYDRPPEDLYRTGAIAVTVFSSLAKQPRELERLIDALDRNQAQAARSLLLKVDGISVVPASFCKTMGIDDSYCKTPECFLGAAKSTATTCPASAPPPLDLVKAVAWYKANPEYSSAPGNVSVPINRHVLSAIAFISEAGASLLKSLPPPTDPSFVERSRSMIIREMSCRAYRDFRLSFQANAGIPVEASSVLDTTSSTQVLFEEWKKSESTLCLKSETPKQYTTEAVLQALLAKVSPPKLSLSNASTSLPPPSWKTTYDLMGSATSAKSRLVGLRIHLQSPLRVVPKAADGSFAEQLTVSGSLSLLLLKDTSNVLACTDYCEIDLGIRVNGLGLQKDGRSLGLFSAGDKVSVQVTPSIIAAAINRIAAVPYFGKPDGTPLFSVTNIQLGPGLLPLSFDLGLILPGTNTPTHLAQMRLSTTESGMGLSLLTDQQQLRDAISQSLHGSVAVKLPIESLGNLTGVTLDQQAWSTGRFCYSGTITIAALVSSGSTVGPDARYLTVKACASTEGTLSLDPVQLSGDQLVIVRETLLPLLIPLLNKLGLSSDLTKSLPRAASAVVEFYSRTKSDHRVVLHIFIGEPLISGTPFPLEVSILGDRLEWPPLDQLGQRILHDQATALAWQVTTRASSLGTTALQAALVDAHFPAQAIEITCQQRPADEKLCNLHFKSTSISIVGVIFRMKGAVAQIDFETSTISGLNIRPLNTEWLTLNPSSPILKVKGTGPSIEVSTIAHLKGLERAFAVSATLDLSNSQLKFDDNNFQQQLFKAMLAQLPAEANASLAGMVLDIGVAKLEKCRLETDPASQVSLHGSFSILNAVPVAVQIPLIPSGSVQFAPDTGRLQELIKGHFSLPGIGEIVPGTITATSWNDFAIPFTMKLTFLTYEVPPIHAILRANGQIDLDEPVTLPLGPTISIGTFSLDHPAVDLYLNNLGEFALKGELVFASQTSTVANVDSTFNAHLGAMTLTLTGVLNVLGNIGLARVDAQLDLGNQTLSGIAKTIGPLAAIMPAQNSIKVDGIACSFEEVTSIQLLGARMDQSLFVQIFGAFPPVTPIKHCGNRTDPGVRLAARGSLQLGPLGNAEGGVDIAVPSFAVSAFATAHVPLILPTTVDVRVNQSFVRARLDASLVRVSINLPTTQALSPALLDELLRSLLNPSINLDAIADALKNGRISIAISSGGSGSSEGNGSNSDQQGDAANGGPSSTNGTANNDTPEQGIVPGRQPATASSNEQRGWPGHASYRFVTVGNLVRREKSIDGGPYTFDLMLTAGRATCLTHGGTVYPQTFHAAHLSWSAVIEGGSITFVPLSDRKDLGGDCFSLASLLSGDGVGAIFSANSAVYLNNLISTAGTLPDPQFEVLTLVLNQYFSRHVQIDVGCLDPQPSPCGLFRISLANGQPEDKRWIVGYKTWTVESGSLLSQVDHVPLAPSIRTLLNYKGSSAVLNQSGNAFLIKLWSSSDPSPFLFAVPDPNGDSKDLEQIARVEPSDSSGPTYWCFPNAVSLGAKVMSDSFSASLQSELVSASSPKPLQLKVLCNHNVKKAVFLSANGGVRSLTLISAGNDGTSCVRSSSEIELRKAAKQWSEPDRSDYPPGADWIGNGMVDKLLKMLVSTQGEWRNAKFGRNPAFLLNTKTGACP